MHISDLVRVSLHLGCFIYHSIWPSFFKGTESAQHGASE